MIEEKDSPSNTTPPKGGRKSTAKEVNARVETVSGWLAQGLTRTEIHRRATEQWSISTRQTEAYCSRAREAAIEAISEPRENLIAQSYAVYQSILADPKASHLIRLRAQQRIDELLGLERPQRHELSGVEMLPPLGVSAVKIIGGIGAQPKIPNGQS